MVFLNPYIYTLSSMLSVFSLQCIMTHCKCIHEGIGSDNIYHCTFNQAIIECMKNIGSSTIQCFLCINVRVISLEAYIFYKLKGTNHDMH